MLVYVEDKSVNFIALILKDTTIKRKYCWKKELMMVLGQRAIMMMIYNMRNRSLLVS